MTDVSTCDFMETEARESALPAKRQTLLMCCYVDISSKHYATCSPACDNNQKVDTLAIPKTNKRLLHHLSLWGKASPNASTP
ncbi:hypothetical protein TNCT_305281 [Trichonephila clavata]|uniref:Uncharacterized protein n=1 Tax=Trichonephila clavata TaxID=2740835 RepID=A0A8X6L0V5_TRICU|nr:hypothetical protein TNCT_305281 [Trichonephila clavata]